MPEQNLYLRFTKRTVPIPADYRPLYKIGHILLILSITARGGKASLMKIHFLAWAIKSKKNIEIVRQWVKTDFGDSFHIWGIEPTVNRALALAAADKLLSEVDGHFKIEKKGSDYIKLILEDPELYTNEKKLLNDLGKSVITESKILQLSKKLL